jgi:hypothetical protein
MMISESVKRVFQETRSTSNEGINYWYLFDGFLKMKRLFR